MDKCAAPTGGGKGRSYDYCYWHDLRNEREVYGATWVEEDVGVVGKSWLLEREGVKVSVVVRWCCHLWQRRRDGGRLVMVRREGSLIVFSMREAKLPWVLLEVTVNGEGYFLW
ncbi:hypothetical protein H0E87_005302 [Populus deltoides]|uniref:Uncharacterized protein n=1 Tax=Populus deltoides TaxID=3696 RepID=A0A8T2ZID9_POPDE|nr:hypothetical protein H0E87_005302 [Populus deltoides]